LQEPVKNGREWRKFSFSEHLLPAFGIITGLVQVRKSRCDIVKCPKSATTIPGHEPWKSSCIHKHRVIFNESRSDCFRVIARAFQCWLGCEDNWVWPQLSSSQNFILVSMVHVHDTRTHCSSWAPKPGILIPAAWYLGSALNHLIYGGCGGLSLVWVDRLKRFIRWLCHCLKWVLWQDCLPSFLISSNSGLLQCTSVFKTPSDRAWWIQNSWVFNHFRDEVEIHSFVWGKSREKSILVSKISTVPNNSLQDHSFLLWVNRW
jgi:hypothetical protein